MACDPSIMTNARKQRKKKFLVYTHIVTMTILNLNFVFRKHCLQKL